MLVEAGLPSEKVEVERVNRLTVLKPAPVVVGVRVLSAVTKGDEGGGESLRLDVLPLLLSYADRDVEVEPKGLVCTLAVGGPLVLAARGLLVPLPERDPVSLLALFK